MEKRNIEEKKGNKEQLESILRITKDTENIAQFTCVELKNQDDCIDRISDKSYQVSQNIDKSERLVRGMSGFFGRVKNFFTKAKPTEKVQQIAPVRGYEPEPVAKGEISKKVQSDGMGSKAKTLDEQEEDKYLDEIAYSVENIKNMAKNISGTLDHQNKKLDLITDVTDRNNTRLANVNYKAKKLLL